MREKDDEVSDSEISLSPADTSLDISDDRLLTLSDEETDRCVQASNALAKYEQAAAERERAATERANAEAARENAEMRRRFIQRIGKRYLPFAGYILFVFPTVVLGYTQIVQYPDFRFWIGSILLSLGPLGALFLLLAADWDRIVGYFNRK